jgi:hypothetical protein
MTTDAEVKWEEIGSLEQLNLGDEVEYRCTGDNKEFKYWGKVLEVAKNFRDEVVVVRMEGDWNLLPSSLTACGAKNKVTRKVVSFVWPKYVGACVLATKDDSVYHYVRVAESGRNEWVLAETGEFFAMWELDLISTGVTHRVLGRGY